MATVTADRKPFPFSPGFLAWMAFIGILLTIGLISAIKVFMQGLTLTNMYDNVPWGLWITIDLSAIALGAGAFTLSAIVYLFGLKRFQPIVRLAVFVGFIGYTCALLTLVMDIGRPDRFWHPWAYWNVHSVLWEITWCITIYLTIMVMEFLPVITEHKFFDRMPWIRHLPIRSIKPLRSLPCLAWAYPSCTNPRWGPPMALLNPGRSGLNPACRSCSFSRQLL